MLITAKVNCQRLETRRTVRIWSRVQNITWYDQEDSQDLKQSPEYYLIWPGGQSGSGAESRTAWASSLHCCCLCFRYFGTAPALCLWPWPPAAESAVLRPFPEKKRHKFNYCCRFDWLIWKYIIQKDIKTLNRYKFKIFSNLRLEMQVWHQNFNYMMKGWELLVKTWLQFLDISGWSHSNTRHQFSQHNDKFIFTHLILFCFD